MLSLVLFISVINKGDWSSADLAVFVSNRFPLLVTTKYKNA